MYISSSLLLCCFMSTVNSYGHVGSGRSVNLTALFLGMLRLPERLTNTKCTGTDNCLSSVKRRRKERKLPDWVLNSGPLSFESNAQPIALRRPAARISVSIKPYIVLKKTNLGNLTIKFYAMIGLTVMFTIFV